MKPSILDRFLRVFTDVHAGEGFIAFLMVANVFLILCAYYFVRPLREGWVAVSDITGRSKMEVKPAVDSLIFCAIILMAEIYSVVFDGAGQGVRLNIGHRNDSESQLLNADSGIGLNGYCR